MNSLLLQKVEQLTPSPGVYLFKDEKGTILYVGKAGNLRNRVGSYFQRPEEKDPKTLALVERIADFDTIVTRTEKEAFLLENNLIKEHHPRYNVRLRDDKTYPCLRLSIEDGFPTLCTVRRIQKDGALYFGPYPSSTALKETLKLIRRLFPIRTCLDTKFARRQRPCLNYEMGRCSGPCCDRITPEAYREVVGQVRMFLEGRDEDLVRRVKAQMEAEAEQLHFEAAAQLRDLIGHIRQVTEKQRVVSADLIDRDVIGLHRRDGSVVIHPLFVRGGKLLGGKGFVLSSPVLADEEVLLAFLHQYYREGRFIPDEVLLPMPVPEQALLEQRLTELKGKASRVLAPARGDRSRLLEMACDNAASFQVAEAEEERNREAFLETLRERLRLTKLPHRVEAFDISNIQGGHAVGSMVVFLEGIPARDRYRHFKIRSIEGADDYGMMYEVLLRRYTRALDEKDLPDLVLIDGGRGQLNVAAEVFRELGIREVDLLSLAKEKLFEKTSRAVWTDEKVFHPLYRGPMTFDRRSPILHFLDRVRDEAHRFAVTHHKKLRGRRTIRSVLGEIPGVGPVRQRQLLKHFGSAEGVREATLEALARVKGMNRETALRVRAFFHPAEEAS
jgi:excinuclease ABC subunit C